MGERPTRQEESTIAEWLCIIFEIITLILLILTAIK